MGLDNTNHINRKSSLRFWLGKSSSLLLLSFIAVNVLLVIDTSIIGISPFTGGIYPLVNYITLFMSMYFVYVIASIIFLRLVKNQIKSSYGFGLKLFNSLIAGITASNLAIIFLLAILIYQIMIGEVYSTWILKSVSFSSYLLGGVLLGILSYKLISWFRRNKSIVLILYFIGMSLMAINSLLIVYSLHIQLETKPNIITYSRTLSGGYSPPPANLKLAEDYLLFGSFCFSWLATGILMKNYYNLRGLIKYSSIMAISMIYFFGQFQPLFYDLFLNLSMVNPVMGTMGYIVFIGSTRPMAGILFGVVFWTLGRNVKKKITKEYLFITGFGIMLLFASNQPLGLPVTPVPPFSLITSAFFGLSSYLLFVGLYSSAVSVSHDSELRKQAKTYAHKLILLDKIGTPEMKQYTESLIRKVMNDLNKNSAYLTDESGVPPSIDEANFKDYLNQVLKQVKQKK